MKEDLFNLEELEHLLSTKAFAELTPGERAMVLLHVSSESEYNDLRDTLKNVKKAFAEEKPVLRPRVDMKEALLKKFEETHAAGTPVQAPAGKKLFELPVFRYGALAAAMMLCLLVIYNTVLKPEPRKEVAINNPVPKDAAADELHTVMPPEDDVISDGSPLENPSAWTTIPSVTESPVTMNAPSEEANEITVSETELSTREKESDQMNMESSPNIYYDREGRAVYKEEGFSVAPPVNNGVTSNMIVDYSSQEKPKTEGFSMFKKDAKDKAMKRSISEQKHNEKQAPAFNKNDDRSGDGKVSMEKGYVAPATRKAAIRRSLVFHDL